MTNVLDRIVRQAGASGESSCRVEVRPEVKLPAHPVRTGQARRGFPARDYHLYIVLLHPA